MQVLPCFCTEAHLTAGSSIRVYHQTYIDVGRTQFWRMLQVPRSSPAWPTHTLVAVFMEPLTGPCNLIAHPLLPLAHAHSWLCIVALDQACHLAVYLLLLLPLAHPHPCGCVRGAFDRTPTFGCAPAAAAAAAPARIWCPRASGGARLWCWRLSSLFTGRGSSPAFHGTAADGSCTASCSTTWG